MAKKQFRPAAGGKKAANINIRVEGYGELVKKLNAFEKSVKKKVLRESLKEMAKPIVKAVAAEAPKDVGILRKSITSKIIAKSKRTGGISLRIGPKNRKTKVVRRMYSQTIKLTKGAQRRLDAGKIKGKVGFANPSKYAHLVALGTYRTGTAKNFFLTGLNRAKAAASKAFQDNVERWVARAAKLAAGGMEL